MSHVGLLKHVKPQYRRITVTLTYVKYLTYLVLHLIFLTVGGKVFSAMCDVEVAMITLTSA